MARFETAVFEAFRSAGVPEDKAASAAEALYRQDIIGGRYPPLVEVLVVVFIVLAGITAPAVAVFLLARGCH